MDETIPPCLSYVVESGMLSALGIISSDPGLSL